MLASVVVLGAYLFSQAPLATAWAPPSMTMAQASALGKARAETASRILDAGLSGYYPLLSEGWRDVLIFRVGDASRAFSLEETSKAMLTAYEFASGKPRIAWQLNLSYFAAQGADWDRFLLRQGLVPGAAPTGRALSDLDLDARYVTYEQKHGDGGLDVCLVMPDGSDPVNLTTDGTISVCPAEVALLVPPATTTPRTGAASIAQGQALIDRWFARARRLKSFIVKVREPFSVTTGPVKRLRKGYLLYEIGGNPNGPDYAIQTPAGVITTDRYRRTYRRWPVSRAAGAMPQNNWMSLLEPAKGPPIHALGGLEPSDLYGTPTVRVLVRGKAGAQATYIHFDALKMTVAGEELAIGTQRWMTAFIDLRLDPPLTPKEFEWTPPRSWSQVSLRSN